MYIYIYKYIHMQNAAQWSFQSFFPYFISFIVTDTCCNKLSDMCGVLLAAIGN